MMMNTPLDGFSIRSTTAAVVPLIVSFIRELAAYEKREASAVATEALLREHLFGSDPAAEVVFGVLHDEVVAFALYFRNFSTFLGKPGTYLEDLYVKPSARGNGNAPAIGFYRSLGAEAMDEWTVHRVSDTALHRLAERLSRQVADM